MKKKTTTREKGKPKQKQLKKHEMFHGKSAEIFDMQKLRLFCERDGKKRFIAAVGVERARFLQTQSHFKILMKFMVKVEIVHNNVLGCVSA